MDGETIDVNVHPTKMELRFQRQQDVYNTVFEGVHRRLLEPELIQRAEVPEPVQPEGPGKAAQGRAGQKESPFLLRPRNTAAEIKPEETRNADAGASVVRAVDEKSADAFVSADVKQEEVQDEDYFIRKMRERVTAYHERMSSAEVADRNQIYRPETQADRIRETVRYGAEKVRTPGDVQAPEKEETVHQEACPAEIKPEENPAPEEEAPSEAPQKPQQLDLFEENFLKRDVRAEYKLIGQVFDTYWLVQFQDSLYIIDQHAAHERVLYERTLKGMKTREFTSQYLSPPIILTLSMQEARLLEEHMDRFTRIGFEIEPFGPEEYAVRAVPDNLFGIAKKELLMEMIDDLADGLNTSMTPDLIDEKVASMSCKAAVKGNNRLSAQEVDALIGELLTLDNPYHCPHGRPTIIAMTKKELEKKFKRIV